MRLKFQPSGRGKAHVGTGALACPAAVICAAAPFIFFTTDSRRHREHLNQQNPEDHEDIAEFLEQIFSSYLYGRSRC